MPTVERKPPPLDLEQVGAAVLELQAAVANMRSKVKDKLIVLMLNDMTGIPKREIQAILDAIPSLSHVYLQRKS